VLAFSMIHHKAQKVVPLDFDRVAIGWLAIVWRVL
jgi:hypothetical protein